MSDGLITVYSRRDERGNNLLEHCQLVTGVGTIQFELGQAQVTPEQAVALAQHPSIMVGREDGHLAAQPVAPAPGPALPAGLQDASPAELELAAAAIATHREGATAFLSWASDVVDALIPADDTPPPTTAPAPAPAAQETDDDGDEPTEAAPTGGEPDDGDPATPAPGDLQVDESVAAAQAMLRQEGEHVPKVVPQGFEAMTGEGEPRCYARKGDGSQCTNAAKLAGEHSTYACGMARHIEQVAKLP